ncbi:hypothetical protein AS029_02630 [Microbacterium enclense]|nr:hypothetical protein AS029_02630 [Microbacterium enclense]
MLGTMRARQLVRSNARDIWRDYADVIGIEHWELTEYLSGASECSVLELDAPDRWREPVRLPELRRLLNVEPAQSFRYLNGRQLTRLRALSMNNPEVPSMTRSIPVPALS